VPKNTPGLAAWAKTTVARAEIVDVERPLRPALLEVAAHDDVPVADELGPGADALPLRLRDRRCEGDAAAGAEQGERNAEAVARDERSAPAEDRGHLGREGERLGRRAQLGEERCLQGRVGRGQPPDRVAVAGVDV